jgi:hypothetical protein
MNKFIFVLLAASPFIFSQEPKDDGTNVNVVQTLRLFATDVSDFSHFDFANQRALLTKSKLGSGEQQALKFGRARTKHRNHEDGFMRTTDVRLVWQRPLDAKHWAVAYDWEWIAASSSQFEIIQVFELRDSDVFFTQQIEADLHGGRSIRANLDSSSHRLTVKSVELDSPNGRCCPRYANVLEFEWSGEEFRRISSHREPLPKN